MTWPDLNPRLAVIVAAVAVAAGLTTVIALDLNREEALAIEAAG